MISVDSENEDDLDDVKDDYDKEAPEDTQDWIPLHHMTVGPKQNLRLVVSPRHCFGLIYFNWMLELITQSKEMI